MEEKARPIIAKPKENILENKLKNSERCPNHLIKALKYKMHPKAKQKTNKPDSGQLGIKTSGQKGKRANGQKGKWAKEQVVLKASGLAGKWASRQVGLRAS